MKRDKPTIQGISWTSKTALYAAKARAKSLGVSLSNYICRLVEHDLRRPGLVPSEKGFPMELPDVLLLHDKESEAHERRHGAER